MVETRIQPSSKLSMRSEPQSNMSNADREFPPSSSTFVPRQVAESKKKSTGALSQDGPLQIARAAIKLLPKLPEHSRIHDNGCGTGNVSRTILTTLPKSEWPACIDATDIALAQAALNKLQAEADSNGWPIRTSVASAQDLSILPDEAFSATIANCVLYRLPDADAVRAAQEMHRILISGGTTIVSGFGITPHRAALAAAHELTRSKGTGPLIGGAVRWEDGSLLESTMRLGGFREVTMHKIETNTVVNDLSDWEYSMWATLGRPASGWLESDETRWDEALSIFAETLRKQPGFTLLQEKDKDNAKQSARLTSQAWIAVARK